MKKRYVKLKYLCKSFCMPVLQQDLAQQGLYEVYGASGIAGYMDTYNVDREYIGIVKDGAGVGRVGKYKAYSSLLGTLAYILPNPEVNIDWLKYVVTSMNLGNDVGKTTIPHIYFSNYGNKKVLYIEKYQQARIAEYLDDLCMELDNIIKKTHKSIEEHKKLKQAIITQTVTKGVRGNREMKDSGIEWIGEIPIDWKLISFRHVLKERQEKNSPIKSKERLSLSIDLGVTLYAEKTANLDRFKDDFEQYKLAHKGDLVMNSMNMIVGATGVSDYFGCVSPVYYTYYDELEDHITAKYCEYIFKSKAMLRVLYSLGKGIYAIVRGDDRINTCRLKVSKDDLKNIIIPVPPVEEQREIVNYLKEKSKEIDELITKKEQYLTEIDNYKKSLIYEYITGKREIPQGN